MASTSETGHIKNVANFETLISFCVGYGSVYKPTKDSLTIVQLEALHTEAKDKLDVFTKARTSHKSISNERRKAFADFKTFSTRVVNAFAVSGVDNLSIDQAKSINKKIQGTSSASKSVGSGSVDDENLPKNISNSQQSFDRLIDHFSNLIAVLREHPMYAPNEEDLQLPALETKLSGFKKHNSNVIASYTVYNNTIIGRDFTLYNPLTGLVQTAKEVKKYVKSIFTTNSPQYKQISALEFKTIKK